MKTQQKWDDSKIVFHNMQFGSVVMPDERRRNTIETEPVIDKEVVVPDLREYDPPPMPVEENGPSSSSSVVEPKMQVEDRVARLLAEKKIVFHCLPATVHRSEDAFYGEVSSRTVFGQKFDFPGVVVDFDDLQLVFWTDKAIPDKSIVFPTKMEMKRWWRVQESVPKSGGYMCSAIPSDVSPDFS